jgi:hypothetical protein
MISARLGNQRTSNLPGPTGSNSAI